MLLEYNQDTNELDLKDKAVELRRRVAGRKLEESLSEGQLTSDGLLNLKELNRHERRTHMNESIDIISSSVKGRIALNRADQHLAAVNQVRNLERDLSRASRLGKAKFDALDDLEKRVKQMRSLLHNPTFQTVDATITQELLTNPKLVKLEKQFQVCEICQRRILISLIDSHMKMCSTIKQSKDKNDLPEKEKLKLVSDVNDTLITSLATFKPHPPRSFKVLKKGISFIEWIWEPPIIDGGLEVTDYEISYHVKHIQFDRKNNKYTKWDEDIIINTSNWLFKPNPVCHYGYKMCNLRANSEYSHFKIRCYNIRGWSDWEKMQENETDKIICDKEIPPTCPLFVTCDKITSSCLHLSWSPPFFDGGLPIIEYQVYYTVVEIKNTVTDRTKKVEKHLSYSTESPEPFTVIRNLPDNTDIVNIYVCAKNQGELVGEKGFCKSNVIRTLKCSRFKQLKKELDYAMSTNNPVIDSDFFTGVRQRLNRVDHIQKLKEELEITPIDEAEEAEINEWTVIKEMKALKQRMEEEALKKAKEIEMMSKFKHFEEIMEDAEEDDDDTAETDYELIEVEEEVPVSEATAKAAAAMNDQSIRKNASGKLVMVVKKHIKKAKPKKKKASKKDQHLAAQRLQGFGFTFAERRHHFQRKLLSYDKKADKLQQERMYIDKVRTENTALMRRREKVQFSYQLERERIKNYGGKSITSSVLTGSDMQYKTSDYIEKLNFAYEQVVQEIANLKYQIIENENRRQMITKELALNEEQKKDRLAKYHEFESHYTKTMKLMHRLNVAQKAASDKSVDSQDSLVKLENERIYRLYFRKFVDFVMELRALKQRIVLMFTNWLLRYKRNAFNKLKYSSLSAQQLEEEQQKMKDTNQITSVGGVLLEEAFQKRNELLEELREVVSDMTTIKQNLHLQKISNKNVKKMKNQVTFNSMEEGLSHYSLFHYQNIHLLYEANLYVQEGKFELASRLYEAQIISIRSKAQQAYDALPRQMKSKMFKTNVLSTQDIKVLSICHGKLGQMFIKMNEVSRGIVEFDRQLSLAKEISDKMEESDAYYGLGVGYLMNFDYENALRYLLIAQNLFLSTYRIQRYYLCLQSIKECYQKLHRQDKIDVVEERLQNTEQTIHKKCAYIAKSLKDMENRLAHTSAEIEYVIKIERTTYVAMEYKKFIVKKEEEIEGMNVELRKQQAVIEKIETLLDLIQKEMTAAIETDELEMWSELVHETPQVVEVEELKQRLKQRSKVEFEELKLQKAVEDKILVKIRNAENEIEEKLQLLSLEEGNLMKHSRHDRPFRVVGLCIANAAGNEVTGTATGGYEEFTAAEGNNIHFIDYHTGELKAVIRGATESQVMLAQFGNKSEDNFGHTGVVTCLLHDGGMIFSGSTDERIICWDTTTKRKLRMMIGHEGSIVTLAAQVKYLVSSAADVTMRLWNKMTGQQVRVIFGHSKSVLSIEIGLKWMLTGSTDHEVRVWKIEEKSATKVEVDTTARLNGHNCPVTCVKYGGIEVLSGDYKGRVFIWWLKTGTVLRQCQIHNGPIKCLQFDSVHIVTGSTDSCVCITDIASGEVLQSLRGHENAVLALAFDSERILTVGGDNTVRYWGWGKKSGPQDKFHVLEPNETLAMVAKRNEISLDLLMKWNGIRNNRQIFVGMKLIVKKGDPDKLTDAEKLAEEREMRQNRGMALTSKKLMGKLQSVDSALNEDDMLMKQKFANRDLIADSKYARIHSLAMNMDYFSLGNRLFGEEKRKLDLFPDHTMDGADNYSLAARIKLGLEEKADESIIGGEQHYISDKPAEPKTQRREKDYRAHLKKTKYFISAENEDEWGHVSDSVGIVMLDMMIELMGYDIVMDQKRESRDRNSVIGRIYQYQNKKLTQTTDAKKDKKKPSKVKWKDKTKKKRASGEGESEGESQSDSDNQSTANYSSADEDTLGEGSTGERKNENRSATILHSREEMKPIPEEEEDDLQPSDKNNSKRKKNSLLKQEEAINHYLDGLIEDEKTTEDLTVAEVKVTDQEPPPFFPTISSKASKNNNSSPRIQKEENLSLPPIPNAKL